MAAINVTHNQDVQSPGIDIALTGLDSTPTWTHFRVVRRDLSGTFSDAVVRGLDRQAQTTATFAGADYEAPFTYYNLEYRLEMYTNSTLSSTITDTIPGPFYPASDAMTDPTLQLMAAAYLRSINTPSISLAVVVADFQSYARSGRVLSKSNVLGRPNPVNQTDVTSGRTGTFDILIGNLPGAEELSDQRTLDLLLAEGDVYMFQSVLSRSSGVEDLYFTIDDITVTREQFQTAGVWGDLSGLTSYLQDDWMFPVLKYSISWTEVDRPPTGDVGVTTTQWQDVLDEYATWQAVLDDNANWLEVLQGTNYPH